MVSSEPNDLHFEPFVHLVDVTEQSALIGWGGFFLRRRDEGWCLVDDDDLPDGRTAGGTIGAESAPYGPAVVDVLDGDEIVASGATDEANHVWIEGLAPNRGYRYRITVDGVEWAAGDRWDWRVDSDGGELAPSGRRYDGRFRTHPAADDPVPVAVLALGDYGVGIVHGDNGRHQIAVARTLERLAATHPVRAIVTLGDNIYHGPEDRLAQSGDEDDDWYFTFYEPYRYLIDHLPVYPTAGNHDGSDEEANDDRGQLEDNFHLTTRFEPAESPGRASRDPGLFYRLDVGGLLELVCIDTTWGEEQGHHYFADPAHQRWLDETFAAAGDNGRPRWQIPFCHHPAWCAGPHHEGMVEQLEPLVARYRRAGVRLTLAGHEHNYQHGQHDGLHHVVTGAGGKLDTRRPTRWTGSGTVAWAGVPHCLLLEADHDRLAVTPFGGTVDDAGDDSPPTPLVAEDADRRPVDAGFVIEG